MATETNPFLLGLSIKDLDSNVRSEISYMDRNLTNGINTQAANGIANTTAQGGLLRDQINRSTDFVVVLEGGTLIFNLFSSRLKDLIKLHLLNKCNLKEFHRFFYRSRNRFG